MIATRVSQSIFTAPVLADRSALLVRIHPQQGIGQPLELCDSPMIVGREGCSLLLSDDSVSRRHAMIEWNQGKHIVTDLRSTNGTYVNENRISEQVLEVGDRVRFGQQIFKYLTPQCIESQYHEVVYKIMTTDGLTQAYNKRYFLESLDREIELCRRSQEPLSVMLLDLDHFKSINDTYGHLAGDAVLSEFARRAKSVIRSGEVFARYGGEEFGMVCSRTTASAAMIAAERIRSVIAESPVVFDEQVIPVTVSIGVVCTDHSAARNIHDFLAEADHWLYVAKNNGRNQARSSATLASSPS